MPLDIATLFFSLFAVAMIFSDLRCRCCFHYAMLFRCRHMAIAAYITKHSDTPLITRHDIIDADDALRATIDTLYSSLHMLRWRTIHITVCHATPLIISPPLMLMPLPLAAYYFYAPCSMLHVAAIIDFRYAALLLFLCFR